MTDSSITRRQMLWGALGLGGVAAASSFGPLSRLVADTIEDRRFVAAYFNGGWDVLLGPDARSRDYAGTLRMGYDMLPAAYRTPRTVEIAGTPVLWGAAMQPVERHADVLTLFRGVNMNTVAHPTGRAYVNTFLPPAGVVARGDSLGTRMATARPTSDLIMPNVAIGVPSYNASYAADVTGVTVARADEVRGLLRPLGDELPPDVEELLRQAQDETGSCVHERVQGGSPDARLRISRARVRQLFEQDLDAQFDFAADDALRTRYAIANPANGREPGVVAATCFKLLTTGLASTVSAQLQVGMDTHSTNWAASQPQRLEQGMTALAALLDDLRVDDPNLDHTTVLAYSEFARTPMINGNSGRDHWFASSILVFGGGLRRGVVGATVEETLGLTGIDVRTGAPDPEGLVMRPEHIGATLAAAAGLDHGAFRVDPLTHWIGGA